jgi:hypothetical protein
MAAAGQRPVDDRPLHPGCDDADRRPWNILDRTWQETATAAALRASLLPNKLHNKYGQKYG